MYQVWTHTDIITGAKKFAGGNRKRNQVVGVGGVRKIYTEALSGTVFLCHVKKRYSLSSR